MDTLATAEPNSGPHALWRREAGHEDLPGGRCRVHPMVFEKGSSCASWFYLGGTHGHDICPPESARAERWQYWRRRPSQADRRARGPAAVSPRINEGLVHGPCRLDPAMLSPSGVTAPPPCSASLASAVHFPERLHPTSSAGGQRTHSGTLPSSRSCKISGLPLFSAGFLAKLRRRPETSCY